MVEPQEGAIIKDMKFALFFKSHSALYPVQFGTPIAASSFKISTDILYIRHITWTLSNVVRV